VRDVAGLEEELARTVLPRARRVSDLDPARDDAVESRAAMAVARAEAFRQVHRLGPHLDRAVRQVRERAAAAKLRAVGVQQEPVDHGAESYSEQQDEQHCGCEAHGATVPTRSTPAVKI